MGFDFEPSWMNAELEEFRSSVIRFLESEMMPADEEARKRGHVGHASWRRAGELGLLCTDIPEAFGGGAAISGTRRSSTRRWRAAPCRA